MQQAAPHRWLPSGALVEHRETARASAMQIIHFKCVFISLTGKMVSFLFYLSLVFPSLYAEIGTSFSLQPQPNINAGNDVRM